MRAIDADALQLAIVEEGQANKRKKYIIGDIWELTGAEIRDVINSQPTIQPEIVRCKDCKHWKDSDGVFRRGTGAESKCPLNLHQVYEGTFFCGLAERREVTT